MVPGCPPPLTRLGLPCPSVPFPHLRPFHLPLRLEIRRSRPTIRAGCGGCVETACAVPWSETGNGALLSLFPPLQTLLSPLRFPSGFHSPCCLSSRGLREGRVHPCCAHPCFAFSPGPRGSGEAGARPAGSALGRGGSLRGCYGSLGSRFFFRTSPLIPRRL